MWLACATQEEIAEATGVPQPTIKGWTDDFIETLAAKHSIIPPGFEPPIYNVWKQQAKSNTVSHFGNSETRWVCLTVQRSSAAC